MELKLIAGATAAAETDAIVLMVYAKEKGAALHGTSAPAVNQATGGWVDELAATGEFTGAALETALLHRPAGLKAKRLLLLGAGKPEKFTPAELRKLAGAALRNLKARSIREFTLVLGSSLARPEMVEAAAGGLVFGNWESDHHKTDPKKHEKAVDLARILVTAATPELEAALERGRLLAEAQNFTRDLVNEPPNLLTPTHMAEAARTMAAETGLECEILDRSRLEQLGMGALLGVAKGSSEPPCVILLRYRPAQSRTEAHLGLIGKGVTFDTGGISIKPADGMEKMKYDMAGAATVLGAMKAIAALKPALAVTAIAPCVENMLSGSAQRPSDIVTAMNGKTVEVLNTDAEGRLILIDAFTYAIRHLGVTHLVDAATLTGACVIALAAVNVGLFSNYDALQAKLLDAARAEGEKMWAMPMDEEYREMLKSTCADIPNISGSRYGGAITAAKFLEDFVEGKPWVHLDIAGTAWVEEAKPWMAKGPSGVAVRTMARLVGSW